MSHIANKLDEINSLIASSNFDGELVFNLLNEIIIDTQLSKAEIAEAMNFKGLIVAMHCPNLTEYEEDETGLTYFIKAFNYNPYELGILFHMLSSFNELDMRQDYTRRNKHIFVKACDILKNELFDSLDNEMKEQLLKKTDQYLEFKKTNTVQVKLDKADTVYNFTVDEFYTYHDHVGEFER